MDVFLICFTVIIISVSLVMFSEYNKTRVIYNKFWMFGSKESPTKFDYYGNEVSIYVKRKRSFDEVCGYNSDVYLDTLYINDIPMISVSIFERAFHKSIEHRFNYDYDKKEIMDIFKYGIKNYDKELSERCKNKRKRIFEKE